MSYETWVLISVVCFCVSAVAIVAAVIMFFNFDIRSIRKELSGKQVENYMEEYRKKKENRKRIGIYDPSGKLIDVKKTGVTPITGRGNTNKAGHVNFADAVGKSKQSASVRSEQGTQVLVRNNANNKDFVILKDYVFTESSEYVG